MNIREWYGYSGKYDQTTSINSCIDGLLELYKKAIMQYFAVDHAESFRDIQNIGQSKLNSGQKLFLNWLNEKGFPYLQELAAKHLPDDDNLISKIEYEKYILEEEMDFEYPEDVRSSLISIVNNIPDYIKAALEVSSSVEVDQIWDDWSTWQNEFQLSLEKEMDFEYPEDVRSSLISILNDIPDYIKVALEVSFSVEIDEIWDNWSTWLSEPQLSDLETLFSKTTYYELKENEYNLSNYREPNGSLFFFGRGINGNI